MTLVEIAAILGAVTGSVSLSFFIYKTLTDKPKLTFEEGRHLCQRPQARRG